VAALEARTGKELWRWYVVPKPGDPGSETWKDKNNSWKPVAAVSGKQESYDPATRLTLWGTGNPVPQYDPHRVRVTPLHRLGRGAQYRQRQTCVAFPIHAERFVDYDEGRRPHALRHNHRRPEPQGRQPFRPQWILLLSGSYERKFIKGARCQRSELDQGLDPESGKPVEYNPKLDVQVYNPVARSLRVTPRSGHARPGTAASHTNPPHITRSSTSLTVWASKAASHKTALRMRSCRRTAASTKEQRETYVQ